MSTFKRKATVDPPSPTIEVPKRKAVWDLQTTEHFNQSCLDQVHKGERNGTTLTKKGWKAAIAQFNSLTGRKYDRAQFKNKWDSLKKEWSLWYKFFAKETGLGWDNVNNTVDVPDEWWDKKQLENPQYAKFRHKGLPFAHQLTTLFKDVVATGQFAWAPSSCVLPTGLHEIDDDDDGYCPCMEGVDVDMEEGSGDSKDISVGATDELAQINLNPSQGSVSEKSGGKRQRVGGGRRTSKNKAPASSRIVDAVSVIAEECKAHNAVTTGASIGEVMAELQTLEAIGNDPDWHTRCCQLMMFKPAREMFIALRGFEDKRLHWLKHAAYNPLPFMTM